MSPLRLFPVLALPLLLVACVGDEPTDESGESDASDEGAVGEAASPQYDPGFQAILQSGVQQASMWRGMTVSGDTEYWAAKSSYNATAARTSSGGSQSCLSFQRTVCGTSWSGATYYRSTYVQSTLSCGAPPSAITPPGGSVSFLGSGSYDATYGGTAIAHTFVSGNVEYWAMDRLIPATGTTTQAPITPYASFGSFVSSVCALSPQPTIWISAYYTQVSNFCSTNPC